MSKGKSQSLIILGIGLILLSGVLFYFSLSQSDTSTVDYSESGTDTSSQDTSDEYKTNSDDLSEDTSNDQTVNNASSSSSGNYSGTYSTTANQNVTTTSADTTATSSDTSVSYPLNLNTCTADELMTINGIGEVRADAIIQYREYLGGYTSVEQIKEIKGIGDTIYEEVSPYLTV
ncbi:MAG: helix-hairpin-helix domain-containing protein [Clostridiales bacterium]|nr:helix-hairpin-helix domain-containing protein [Clostridiales bacterium]